MAHQDPDMTQRPDFDDIELYLIRATP